MFTYDAFGLRVASEIKLAELASAVDARAPDLYVRCGDLLGAAPIAGDEADLQLVADTVVMAFPGVARFVLSPASREIVFQPTPEGRGLVHLPLLGPVMAVWLHLQDALVLHASAVELEGGVVAFVGDKGAGKSTTAAALTRAGARLVTDDLLRVRWSEAGEALCDPAYPQIKLTDEAAARLAPDGGRALEPPHPLFAKQLWRVSDIERGPKPLAAICVLARAPRLRLRRLDPGEALQAVLTYAFVRRFGSALVAGARGASHFARAARLAQHTPVLAASLPDQLEALARNTPALIRQLAGQGR